MHELWSRMAIVGLVAGGLACTGSEVVNVADGTGTGTDTDTGTGDDGPAPEGPDAFEPFARSGTRLEHRGWIAGEAFAYDRTWDSELGTYCQFVTAQDGEVRCIPRPGLMFLFSDAECSDSGRMYMVFQSESLPCGVPPVVGRQLDPVGCAEGVWVGDALTPAPAPAAFYFTGADGSCLGGGAAPEGSYFAASALSPAAFVRADRVEELTAEGVGVVAMEGDDGSRLVVAPLDSRYDGVRPETLEQPSGLRLVPEITAYPSPVYEPACGAELVYAVPICEADRVGAVLDAGVAYHPGPLLAPQDIDAGDCGSPGSTGVEHLRRGDPMVDADLVGLEEVPLGAGSVQVRALAAQTGERLMLAEPALTSTDGHCMPLPGPTDGQFSCLPVATESRHFYHFADAACTDPVLYAIEENELLAPGDLVATRGEGVCGHEPRVSSLWRIAGTHEGPYYTLGDGDCNGPEDPIEPWFALEPVDPASLPTLDYGAVP